LNCADLFWFIKYQGFRFLITFFHTFSPTTSTTSQRGIKGGGGTRVSEFCSFKGVSTPNGCLAPPPSWKEKIQAPPPFGRIPVYIY